jgi:PadR family transcriptional regulator, regulatory protein PadR
MARLLAKPLQGSLNLLILKTLSRGPLHGYGITNHIQAISDEVLQVEEGSLYPALHRMEQEGWITSEWALSDTNRRVRYYKLTANGKRQLAKEENDWKQVTAAVAKVLNFAS